MAQEKIDDWMQDAKDLAKAERELKIEHWVYITFEVRDEDRNREILHIIDIPRAMLDRWRWVIEWRRAKLVCKYPRKKIWVYHCAYDKRTGLQTGFDFLLGKVASAKAQITKVERAIAKYIDYMTHNDLFFSKRKIIMKRMPFYRQKSSSINRTAPCINYLLDSKSWASSAL